MINVILDDTLLFLVRYHLVLVTRTMYYVYIKVLGRADNHSGCDHLTNKEINITSDQDAKTVHNNKKEHLTP